jgi:predicted nucleotidyltransferase
VDYVSPLEELFPGVASSVLSVLARTSQPLTLRQIAERARASHPQVSRHVEHLEALGVVERRVVGRAHLVTLTRSAAANLIRRFTQLADEVLTHMSTTAKRLEPPPDSIIVFGSFARGEARADSDIDVAVGAPPAYVDDDAWLETLAAWVEDVETFAASPVADIVVSRTDLVEREHEPLWDRIRNEGIVIAGSSLDELLESASAVATDGAT